MEAKFLASVISFLSIFLAIYAEPAIYYGDSNVNIGEPFSITCIVPLADPIFWLKDGEPITRHNLRHGRDEHSYMLSESAIEGEKHKIEAHLSVRHALKVHEGQYECNNLHSINHTLHVHSANEAPSYPQTYSPSVVTAGGGGDGGGHLSTFSAYETVFDLTPSSADDDIFTRMWGKDTTQSTTTTTHRRPHHHHHQQQHKLIYLNATNVDGNPSLTLPDRSSDLSSVGSEQDSGRINVGYVTPKKHGGDITTAPGRGGSSGGGGGVGVAKYPPMPNFPPPRTTMLSTTAAPAVELYPPTQQHTDHYYYGITGSSSSNSNNMNNNNNNPFTTNGYQPVSLQTASPSPYYQQPTQQQSGVQPMMPTDAYQTEIYHHQQQQQQQRNQLQIYPTVQFINPNSSRQNQRQQQQRQPVSSVTTAVSAGGTTPSTPLSPQPTPTAHMPIRKDTDLLVPNYDNAEHRLKIFEIRSPLVLSCNVTKEGDHELKWQKNHTDVDKVESLKGRHKVLAAERKFIIDRTNIGDDGLYSCCLDKSCSADDQKQDINVVARVAVRVPSNSPVVEGEKLSIVCTSIGTDPQLSWKIGNLTITNSTGRYILKPDEENNVKNAILSVENVSLDDRGEFKCIGRNLANEYGDLAEASDVSFVRVKGKLAALWPFLGICAEVLILCAIILIYEKRRNKSELDESDTDPQDHQEELKDEELVAQIQEYIENPKQDDEPVKIIRLHPDDYYTN